MCDTLCSLLVRAAGQLQSTAQQLREELRSTLSSLQSELQSAAETLAAHNTALEGAVSVAAAVKLLTGLPAAVADLSARLDELEQAQRAAEGELCANKEHCLALDQQAAAAQAQLQVLEASLAALPAQEGGALQQLRQEMLEPVVEVGEGTGCGFEEACVAASRVERGCETCMHCPVLQGQKHSHTL